jgi:SAM-dependent methyltransferase
MLTFLKNIFKRTPLLAIWNKVLQWKHQNYLKSISSTRPVYPLYCISCNRYYKEFRPITSFLDDMYIKHGSAYRMSQFETLNTANYQCPGCYINDRDRLCAMYLKKRIDPAKEYHLIEFAPTKSFGKAVKSFENIHHRTANLLPDDVDDQVDLMDMHIYEDGRFDVFVCSHILEHVIDDSKAMTELYRILKPSGFGIVLVPIIPALERTLEDPSINDEALQWKYFCQGDHVRMYKKTDFISRLEGVGFKVTQCGKDYFGETVFRQNGITETSVLYVVEK